MRTSAMVLFICAGLMLSGGAVLCGSAAWSLLRMSYYFWTSDLGIELAASVPIIAGALLCLPTCWLATIVPYHTKSISLMGTLMALTIASMTMLSLGISSISGLSRAVREPTALNASMLHAMTHVGFDAAVRSSFSAMQIELKCCGVQSYSDWYQYRRSLPPACCGRVWNGKRNDQCLVPLYTNGCLRPALCELRNFSNSLSVLSSAVILVLAVTLFAGAYTLAAGVVERSESHLKPQPLRIACLPHGPCALPLPLASLANPTDQIGRQV